MNTRVKAVSTGSDLTAVKFDHATDSLRKSLGITKEVAKQCKKIACDAHKTSDRPSQVIEKVWNSDVLSLSARIYTTYSIGCANGVKEGMHVAAACTAQMISLGRVIGKSKKK